MSNAEISLREVYDVLVEVRDDVTALKTSMDSTKTDVADHETRIRGLEKLVWKAAGAAAVVGSGGGWLVSTFLS